jgi:hypothetical protein
MSATCSPGGVERAVRRLNGSTRRAEIRAHRTTSCLTTARSVPHCVIGDEGASRASSIVKAAAVRAGDVQDPAARRFATTPG